MRTTLTIAVTIIAVFVPTCDTSAQTTSPERAGLLKALSECRPIAEDAERLRCFDHAADALDTAERQGDVVVMDRDQVRQARRQLFGFSAPALPSIFGRGDDGATEGSDIDAVETTLVRAGQDHEGKWTFRLADGSEWRQIDSAPVRFQNRVGTEIRVRRAALGSYLLTAGKSRAVRVKRQ